MMDFEGAIAEIKNKDNTETFNKSIHSLQAIVDNLLGHGTHGLAALKTLIDTIASDLDNGSYGLSALEVLVTDVENKLDDGTTGLAALKALIDVLGGELGNGTYGLAELKALIDAIDARLVDSTTGLAALKVLIDALGGELGSGTYGLAALKALIDAIEAKLDDGTSGLDALKTLLDAVQVKLDKLAGEAPISGSVTGNWNSGTATSGETGANVVTIGANNTKKKLHSLILSIHNFQSGGKVTVKLFMQVNGTERKVYQEDFNKGNDPDGCWVV
ncbi:MAG: hypothetical protein Q8O55_12510, partial [Dehalococcoidales bacterium]|nr:hypothetical protein [Dehalococcoidales bacterium]